MRRVFLSALFSLFAFVLFARPAFAQGKTAVAHSPVFIAQDTVILDDEYADTVFVMGGEVTLTGTIHGDLVVLGGSVRVRGTVDGDVYAFAGSTFIESKVGGNVVVAGSEVRTTNSASISGSLISASKRLVTGGTILGDVRARTKEAITDAKVGGVSQVEVMKPREVTPLTTAQKIFLLINRFLFEVLWRSMVLGFIWFFGRKGLETGSKLLQAHPVKTFFDGVTVAVFTSIAALLFLITLFGFPIFLVIVASLLAAALSGWVFVIPWIGEKVLPKQPFWMSTIAGLLVLSLVVSIPVVGWIAQMILVGLSIGVWWNLLHTARVKKSKDL